MAYPENIKTWSQDLAPKDPVKAEHINELREEIEAIEALLGLKSSIQDIGNSSLSQYLASLKAIVTSAATDLIPTITEEIRKSQNAGTTEEFGVNKIYSATDDNNNGIINKENFDDLTTEKLGEYFDANGKLIADSLPEGFNNIRYMGIITVSNSTTEIKVPNTDLNSFKDFKNEYGGYYILSFDNTIPTSTKSVNIKGLTLGGTVSNPTVSVSNSAVYTNQSITDLTRLQFIRNQPNPNQVGTYTVLLINGLGVTDILAEGVPYNTSSVNIKLKDFKSFNDHILKIGTGTEAGHVKINQTDLSDGWDFTKNDIVPRMKDLSDLKKYTSSVSQTYVGNGNIHLNGSNISADLLNNIRISNSSAPEAIEEFLNNNIINTNLSYSYNSISGYTGTLFNNPSQVIIPLPENIVDFKELELEFFYNEQIKLRLIRVKENNSYNMIYRTEGLWANWANNNKVTRTWNGWFTAYVKKDTYNAADALPDGILLNSTSKVEYDTNNNRWNIILDFSPILSDLILKSSYYKKEYNYYISYKNQPHKIFNETIPYSYKLYF